MSTNLRNAWEFFTETSLASVSQFKYLLSVYKQYKTKKFDTKAEQWRTEQENSGKFKEHFSKFLRRPVTFNVLILWFELKINVRFQFKLAELNNDEKNDLQFTYLQCIIRPPRCWSKISTISAVNCLAVSNCTVWQFNEIAVNHKTFLQQQT